MFNIWHVIFLVLNKSKALSVRAGISLFALLLLCNNVFAQETEYDPIDFSVNDVSISTALVQLAMVADFNFSFNSDDESLNKKITYSASNRAPLAILDDLLTNTNHIYKIIGKQVVIFTDVDKEEKTEVIVAPPQVITKYITQNVYDTIEITDTVTQILTDTVFLAVTDTLIQVVTDTLRITDTVFIEKEKERKQNNKIKDIPVDFFNMQDKREKGIALGFNLAPIVSDLTFIENNDKLSFRIFSLGVDGYWLSNSWAFSGGLKLTHFAEKFYHQYTDQQGGFYITDTIEEYYTISQGDTSYFYVTDSTWKPVELYEYNYDINNRVGMIEFSLAATYYIYSSNKLRYYIRAGGQLSFHIYKKGLALPESKSPEGVPFSDLEFASQSFSIIGGTGIQYRLNENFDFNTEVYYVHYLNDLIKDYPDKIKLRGIGLKVGLVYFF